jgi:two-component system chemotaxis response regulator CheB
MNCEIRGRFMGSTFRIVAIGASAGGNVALRHILSYLSANFPAPIVYLNSHNAAEPGWLAQDSVLPAQWAKEGEALATGTIYVCPPGFFYRIQADDTIRLIKAHPDPATEARIDPFFQSVADGYGAKASAVVLSGDGKDGTVGVRALRAKRGMVLVQDPRSALHPEMPSAVLATGVVEHVLFTGAIAPFLNRLMPT